MIAHRGASAAFPEHTRAAMLHALAVGADGLECDVQLTRDREVVCWHDPTVDRTSDGRGAVADHTLDRLRGLDVVSWHARRPGAEPATTTAPPAVYDGAGEQVLTLTDLLAIATAADRPLRLAVELKHPSPFGHELEERVLRELLRAYPPARVEGVEWSRPLAWLARWRARGAVVRRGDLWADDWAPFALVYAFQRPESMPRLWAKACAELAPDAWLVSLDFAVPGVEPVASWQLGNGQFVWLYRPARNAVQKPAK